MRISVSFSLSNFVPYNLIESIRALRPFCLVCSPFKILPITKRLTHTRAILFVCEVERVGNVASVIVAHAVLILEPIRPNKARTNSIVTLKTPLVCGKFGLSKSIFPIYLLNLRTAAREYFHGRRNKANAFKYAPAHYFTLFFFCFDVASLFLAGRQ